MIEKYLQICDLLDCFGHVHPRLDAIQKIIQQPDFRYELYESPEILMGTFLASSYWLDQELFDESCLYKKEKQNLPSVQQIHIKMLDIGAVLLDKGFPLEYEPERFSENGPNQLANYVKTFVEQCHKRRTFLKRQKTKRISQMQKVRD